jgi:hypothetical protein
MRADQGFGSSDDLPNSTIQLINHNHQTTNTILQMDGINPFNVWLSTDPYQKQMHIQIQVTGHHLTLGMLLQHGSNQHRLILTGMEKNTPGAKVPRWRSTLKCATLLSIEGESITNKHDIRRIIAHAKATNKQTVNCIFATIQYHSLHPTEGLLMLYYDHLKVIAQHLHPKPSQTPTHTSTPTIDDDADTSTHPLDAHIHNIDDPHINPNDIGQFFRLNQLKKRPDWQQWQQARYKMLDDYKNQDMFSEPMPEPKDANVQHMLWRYTVKMCGMRKARMVCDGSPSQGTITLRYTFANSPDAASERLFWAVTAQKGLTAYGADCSNAFAEAPLPKFPLYMRIDEAFREWWVEHLKRPPIPAHYTVICIQHVIQGHPESHRLWE